MKKFIAQTYKGKTSIYECEVSIFKPRPYDLKPGEELFVVESPKQFKGERWFSMFFRDSVDECLKQLEVDIRVELERLSRKCCNRTEEQCIPFEEKDVAEKLSQVEIVRL